MQINKGKRTKIESRKIVLGDKDGEKGKYRKYKAYNRDNIYILCA